MKFVINDPKSGKTYQIELDGTKLYGRQIKDKIKGNLIDISDYEFEITGGSDDCGFPMRPDLPLSGRKKLLLTKSIGARIKKKGERRRKTVCGNIINDKIHQLNMKIIKYGKKAPEELFKKKEGSEEAPKKEKKPEPKKEKSVTEKPKEEVKEQPKEEKKEDKKE